MSDYMEETGDPFTGKKKEELKKFLEYMGLTYDEQITHSIVLRKEKEIIATASCQKNIIKCVAVSEAYQGQNLLAHLMTSLIEYFYGMGISHFFGFTKPQNKELFCSMGMYPVTQTEKILLLENDKNGLSKEAYNFIAGLMKHMRSMTAIINPIVNSYKRLVPGYEAPTYIAWSATNRSPLIRVPAARGLGTRVELRSPDCATNPYLAIAVCLAAGLDGIKNNLQPVDSIQRDIYSMTDEERDEAGIENLPKNLYEAIQEMRKSDFVKGVLGKEVFKKYIKAKEEEWMEYTSQVTDWEIDRYLGRI